METKVEQQESELGETVMEAEQALDSARRDLALISALHRFVDAVGAPLLAQRRAEMHQQLSNTLEHLYTLHDEVRYIWSTWLVVR